MKRPSVPSNPRRLPPIGWREFVGLPDLGIRRIRAKIDTGARSSALHAVDLRIESGDALFSVCDGARKRAARIRAPVAGMRKVRSSSGQVEERPLVRTHLQVGTRTWLIDLTLTDRSDMGFELLLGRQAVRNRLLVDAGKSFLWGR